VKVVRGGTLLDDDPLALRSAARNHVGLGTDAPPRPANRFEWVGFRCASYEERGRDAVGPLLHRVVEGRVVAEEHLAAGAYAGEIADPEALPTPAPDGVHVFARSVALVAVPVEAVGPRARSLADVLDASVEGEPIVLAALRLDVALEGLRLPAPPHRGRPTFRAGSLVPGTCLLALKDRRLWLLSPTLDVLAALTDPLPTADVARWLAAGGPPRAAWTLRPADDTLLLEVSVPAGARGARLDLRVGLRTPPGALVLAGRWR
jgi:hypothetical protein